MDITNVRQMSFGYPFRTYQRLILDRLEDRLATPDDKETFHIVSPPGSGKTILGLEMAHRLGDRAVIFAPTTTIQRQWADKVAMFCAPGTGTASLVSTDPRSLAPITALTYQVLSTVATASEALREAARALWESDLAAGNPDELEPARLRLDTMKANNKAAYDKELRRRIGSVRRRALEDPTTDLATLLHPNARRLIDEIVASGVRTVVLDECHHLLDYWAIVLTYLIKQIDKPRVIGLTATLPSVEDGTEYENYTSLLGDVTYEVPTPAVVKEGDLAPYRDLVAFVELDADEDAFLEAAHAGLEAALTDLCSGPRFTAWLLAGGPGRGGDPHEMWTQSLKDNAPLAVASLRHAYALGLIPTEESPNGPFAGVPFPFVAQQPPTIDDRLAVAERFALDALKLSADNADHARLTAFEHALASCGMTLLETGLRQRRPVTESVFSYSLSKTSAAAQVLGEEAAALGERFRAIVVTDFEKTGSLLPGEPKDLQRGSARRVFLELTTHPSSRDLDPVLVTGKTLWIDVDHGQRLISWFNIWLEINGYQTRCSTSPNPAESILEVKGGGAGWTSGTYVRMVTAALEAGVISVLVGTRGLFTEGWDALSLSVMIDLTTAATSTSTQQLRGRAIRLDPTWPEKVAHNWEIVCVPSKPSLPRSAFADARRLRARHCAVWGITPDYDVIPEYVGRVTRGLAHVDPSIDQALRAMEDGDGIVGAMRPAEGRRRLVRATKRSFDQIGRRAWSREKWHIGDPYDNESQLATTLTAPSLPMRTSFTLAGTLRKLLAQFRVGLIGLGASALLQVLLLLQASGGRSLSLWLIVAAVGLATVVFLAVGTFRATKIVKELQRTDHADMVLKDVSRTIVLTLKELRLISVQAQPGDALVIETPGLEYEVTLVRASREDSELFVTCMSEALAPINNQRYLISRDVSEFPQIWLRPVWVALRRWVGGDAGITYHPVPDVFGARKEYALRYQHHWSRNVGAGDLVFTKNLAGFEELLAICEHQQPESESSIYDVWR